MPAEPPDVNPPKPPDPAWTPPPRAARLATWLAAAAIALALLLVWLPRHGGVAPRDEASEVAEAGGGAGSAKAGQPARLDFTLKDLHGASVPLSAAKGKIILLNFWATWCGPCKAEIPDLVKLQDAHRADVIVLGVLVLDPMDAGTQRFADAFGINYTILDGNDREDLQAAYGPMYGIPTTIIIGRDGRIVSKHAGARTKAQFEREISPLL